MNSYKILSIEAKDLYGAMNPVSREKGYSVCREDGEPSLRRFSNALAWSLDSMKLTEVYERRIRRKDFAFKAGRHWYTRQIINVTFKYSYKEFNMAGNNTYVRAGYVYKECEFNDSAAVKDGVLIGIHTNVHVENPISEELLRPYFSFNGDSYEIAGSFPVIKDKSSLREYLYENGFICDGIEYVRYKRSSGSSRVGKCLFVNKVLAADMEEWDKCGLDIEPGQQIDLAAYEAYIALSMSSIIDTMTILPENILVIDDQRSKFDDDVVAVEIDGDHLVASDARVTVENSLFDGESLMDTSLFGKYADKGMLLLRNRFFKSCCFNTNLQQWFEDNGITDVSQLNGFTLAKDIRDVKFVTTPSSIKYAKFGRIEDWLMNAGTTFGIVKYEKKPHPFDGRMVQAHYQLFNTLQLSYEEMEEILKPSLDYISGVRNDPAVLRYAIRYPIDEDDDDGEWSSLESKNDIIYRLLGVNDKFAHTKLFYDFRDDLVRGLIRNLKRGHVLVHGNYSTMMGNGHEMLKAAIGTFDGTSSLAPREIHSTRFDYDKKLLCSRSPHVCSGNIMLVENRASDAYDRYFNLTPEIVCVNAVNENIQQMLNGCDYDSDTILITDHPLLIKAAERHYGEFKVPTNMTTSVKRKRFYTSADRADLDVKTSVNKIGEIINLSQHLNSIMWERIHKGATLQECNEIFLDICKLAVLSNIEIDRAKKEFVISSVTELNAMKAKYHVEDDGRQVKPYFFKMITTENGFELSDKIKYRYFDTAMDYLQHIISKFKFREGRERKRTVIPFMDIVKAPDGDYRQGYYYSRKDQIVSMVRAMNEQRKRLYVDYDKMTKAERKIVWTAAGELKQDCIDEICRLPMTPATMYVTLKEIEGKDCADVSRLLFDVLFGKPDEQFFTMIRESKEEIYSLEECEDGDIDFYGFKFKKVPIGRRE